MSSTEKNVIFYPGIWGEVATQEMPNVVGTIFISCVDSIERNSPSYIVSMWVDDAVDTTLNLGKFWTLRNAQIFATAKARENETI